MYLAAGGGSSYTSFLLILAIPLALYFLMIRPQQRRMREAQNMQSSLEPGAEVMTTSGIYGTVAEIDIEAGTVSLEVSPDIYITFAKGAVTRVITPAPAATIDDETDLDADTDVDAADEPVTPFGAEESNSVIDRRKD